MQEIPGLIPGSGRSAREGIGYPSQCSGDLLVAQLVKNLPEMQETWVRSLGWEDPLEKEKATHSSFLTWRIPWTVQSMGSQRIGHAWATFTFTSSRSTKIPTKVRQRASRGDPAGATLGVPIRWGQWSSNWRQKNPYMPQASLHWPQEKHGATINRIYQERNGLEARTSNHIYFKTHWS